MNCSVVLSLVDSWGFYAALALLFLLVVAMIVTFAVTERRTKNYKRILEEQSNSVRVFILNLREDDVQYFNVTSLHTVHHCSVSEFYQKFPFSEQKKVINWINAVMDPSTQAPEYLETDIQENRTRRQYFSMLQVEAVDFEHQILHLQSYLLKYMGTSKNDGPNNHGLSTMKEVEEAILAGGTRRGLTMAFRFVYKRITDKDKEIDPLAFNQFKNALFPFLQGKRYLLQASGNELVFCDLRLEEKAKGVYLVRSCLNAVNRYMVLNGVSSTIDVRVGVAEHRFFAKEPEKIVETARRLAVEAFADRDSTIWYERGRKSYNATDDSSYRTEVERIINEKKLRYRFRPVFWVTQGRVMGYLTKAEPVETYFDSMEDLKDYAMRTEDDRSLFHTVAKETIQRFLSERPSDQQCLFYSVRLTERGYMLLTFARIPGARNAHLVLTFDEADISSHLDHMDDDGIISDMRAIKAKGYEVALVLNSSQLQLSAKVYGAFDYFICSFAFENAAVEGSSTRLRSHLHTLVEKLLKYNKPIIASDFDGWPAVELMVRSGLEYISSEAFAPYDVMMNPINPKIVKRVKDMKN